MKSLHSDSLVNTNNTKNQLGHIADILVKGTQAIKNFFNDLIYKHEKFTQ